MSHFSPKISSAVRGGGILQNMYAYFVGSGDTASASTASASTASTASTALSTERVAQIEREVRDSYSSKKSISPKDQEIVTDLAVAFAIIKESSEIYTKYMISWGLSDTNLKQFLANWKSSRHMDKKSDTKFY